MYRRALIPVSRVGFACFNVFGARFLTIDSAKRDELTKHLTALKEECKGQGLDLADMNEAAKDAGKAVQEKVKQLGIDDTDFKAKVLTLSASVKAYHTRLANLQTETKSLQGEVDAVLKMMWGTENPAAANFSTPPPPSSPPREEKTAGSSDFAVEPPPIAQVVENLNKSGSKDTPKVETVEGERIPSDAAPNSSASSGAEKKEEEIEVETIEIEVEPSDSTSSDPAEDAVDKMKITDITSDLYERGINFSDCLDAKSLRQRYKDVLKGKIAAPINPPKPKENTNQPPMPKRADTQHYQHQQQYNSTPNTSEAGLAHDPYPNAHRKMVDPMKYVEEVKRELCAEQGIDPKSVDLWSGKVRLDDKKRLYDYPTVQSYPIEVRQKGDIPK